MKENQNPNSVFDIKSEMLSLCKLPSYQQLNAYYGQESLFSILDIERNENRHSAFLAWLMNPDAHLWLSHE